MQLVAEEVDLRVAQEGVAQVLDGEAGRAEGHRLQEHEHAEHGVEEQRLQQVRQLHAQLHVAATRYSNSSINWSTSNKYNYFLFIIIFLSIIDFSRVQTG